MLVTTETHPSANLHWSNSFDQSVIDTVSAGQRSPQYVQDLTTYSQLMRDVHDVESVLRKKKFLMISLESRIRKELHDVRGKVTKNKARMTPYNRPVADTTSDLGHIPCLASNREGVIELRELLAAKGRLAKKALNDNNINNRSGSSPEDHSADKLGTF